MQCLKNGKNNNTKLTFKKPEIASNQQSALVICSSAAFIEKIIIQMNYIEWVILDELRSNKCWCLGALLQIALAPHWLWLTLALLRS